MVETYRNFQIYPDIVLMDYRMPKMNGLDATREILKTNPNCRIIFISADSRIERKAREFGATAFLEKPISFSALLSCLIQ